VRGEILLGDLAVALDRLGRVLPPKAGETPDRSTLGPSEEDAIARLLGLRITAPVPVVVLPDVAPTAAPPPAPPADRPPPAPRPAPPLPGVIAGLRVEPAPPRALPPWPGGAELPSEAAPLKAPVAPPLLNPRWARGVLTGALGTWVHEGDIDAPRAVELLLRRTPAPLPRLPLRVLRRGAEVLVDRGPGMAPFAGDVDPLLDDLRLTLGPDRWSARVFRGDPRQVVDPRTGHLRRFHPAERGRPILALTDLGLGEGDPSAWLSVADLARRHGCPLVALVPWPRSAWPRVLRQRIHLVCWDRPTTALQARQRRPR
jgi:hypothetical protein